MESQIALQDHPRNRYKIHRLHEKSLGVMADSFLFLFDNMPSVPVIIVNRPIQELKGRVIAYYFRGIIYIKREYFYLSWADIPRTLKHELIHAWMYWKGLNINDSKNHGPIFRQKAREVGVRL